MGLTTKQAPFIEQAQASGQIYIHQPYELYSPENHETWRRLMARQTERWERYANQRFLDGLEVLHLDWQQVPRLEDINKFMKPRTGFQAKPVAGYVPSYIFFDCLKNREFPTTITIRDGSSLDYLPEPDIFHDVAGHVPMHTDPAFAEALVRFGQCAQTAAELVHEMKDGDARVRRLTSIIKALARFFWYTVEFGIMKGTKPGELKVYGSGLLSSYGEIAHAVESPLVQRFPIQLEWVVNQYFEIDSYQPLLFIVDSFEHLFDLVGELETWMKDGKLDNVSGGEPGVSEADLRSFMEAMVPAGAA